MVRGFQIVESTNAIKGGSRGPALIRDSQVKGGAYASTSDVSWLGWNPSAVDSFSLNTVLSRPGVCPDGRFYQSCNAASLSNRYAGAYALGNHIDLRRF